VLLSKVILSSSLSITDRFEKNGELKKDRDIPELACGNPPIKKPEK
jgi:hypothetical protein